MNIFVPKGAFGASEYDNELDSVMRKIALACPHNEGDWVEKYGTEFENDIFMMKPYCWCERETCAWCSGCNCPDSAFHYYKNNIEIDSETYHKEFSEFSGKMPHELYKHGTLQYKKYDKTWNKKIKERNKIYKIKKDDVCDYCTGQGIFSKNGSIAGMGAPNFWHKPSGLRVYWYKYIGRGVEVYGKESLGVVLKECLESLKVINAN